MKKLIFVLLMTPLLIANAFAAETGGNAAIGELLQLQTRLDAVNAQLASEHQQLAQLKTALTQARRVDKEKKLVAIPVIALGIGAAAWQRKVGLIANLLKVAKPAGVANDGFITAEDLAVGARGLKELHFLGSEGWLGKLIGSQFALSGDFSGSILLQAAKVLGAFGAEVAAVDATKIFLDMNPADVESAIQNIKREEARLKPLEEKQIELQNTIEARRKQIG